MKRVMSVLAVNPALGQCCPISTNVKVAGGGRRKATKNVDYMPRIENRGLNRHSVKSAWHLIPYDFVGTVSPRTARCKAFSRVIAQLLRVKITQHLAARGLTLREPASVSSPALQPLDRARAMLARLRLVLNTLAGSEPIKSYAMRYSYLFSVMLTGPRRVSGIKGIS